MHQAHWNYPTSITVGEHCTDHLADYCQEAGINNPMMVTDPTLAVSKMVRDTLTRCRQSELKLELFNDIQGNPTSGNVAAGVKHYLNGKHDGIIAFGGGSSIDAAKAIALVAKQSHSLWDFEDQGENWKLADPKLIAPVIAIPTTAGTGAEVGRAAVITDEAKLVKKIIFHPQMMPIQVFLDPFLITELPPELTAATGMDALSHSLEAFCSHTYHPMADAISLEAMRMIMHYLPVAYLDGLNTNARTQMLVASTMGATAFQKGLGGMHALSHSLGALYNKHHGLLNAILMPYVLVANRPHINEKMDRLGRYLALPHPSFDGVLNWILSLRAELHIPNTLAEIGIDSQQAIRLGAMAVSDPAAAGNPIQLTAEQYADIVTRAVDGRLH
ncbi:iron-containing alcohol dehydrogenase [Photobacterium sp. SDRW27]|uniref:iron-containing alcohol dehydrogenase n=1 Tax=Photobacterium obscurum TaxID=2829490 RepID=UPI0022443CFF|nr:iron-containing alcohol dehydrogenase [Photobacterium obscurum]MCW8328690.1 iron-containing alcohol dehydrogenase [Photobacterium obscurum]